MKLITTNTNSENKLPATQTCGMWQNSYTASCQKVLAQIAAVKEAILAEAQQAMNAPERLLQLALNEAEMLAWQTTYPHLVFPTLATEKVQAVAAWNVTQKSVWRDSPVLA